MSSYQSGKLRHRITFQSASTTPDTVGGQTQEWTDLATVWGLVEILSGRELLAALAVQSEDTGTITLRYQTRFADPKYMAALRAVWVKDGITRIFNITGSHDDDEMRRYLILNVNEALNNG